MRLRSQVLEAGVFTESWKATKVRKATLKAAWYNSLNEKKSLVQFKGYLTGINYIPTSYFSTMHIINISHHKRNPAMD